MNVYDFDLTIYPTDCAIDFCIWCMKRHPKLWFTYFPKLVKVMIQRKLGKVPEYLKHRKFLSYLTMIDDFEERKEFSNANHIIYYLNLYFLPPNSGQNKIP